MATRKRNRDHSDNNRIPPSDKRKSKVARNRARTPEPPPIAERSSMRLNRYLALAGLGSRRSVEPLIQEGKIAVNGVVTSQLATRINPSEDRVALWESEWRLLRIPTQCSVYAWNKLAGYICSRGDKASGYPSIYKVLPLKYAGLVYIGRLDVATTGLLLFTNDGVLAHRLTHPAYEIPRRYQVELKRPFGPKDYQALEKGIVIDGRATSPPKILRVQEEGLSVLVELKEGRNREVRKIFAAIGHELQSLNRVSFAGIELSPLPPGQGKELSVNQVHWLRRKVGLA